MAESPVELEEKLLLIIFLAIASYMYIEAFSFSASAAQFPQLTAMVVIVGCLLILFRHYLPAQLQPLIGMTDVFGSEAAEVIQEQEDVEIPDEEDQETVDTLDRPVGPKIFTGVSLTLYIALGQLLGLLWITPLFVAVYGLWFRQPMKIIVLLAVIAGAVALGFDIMLNLRLTTGFLTEGLL